MKYSFLLILLLIISQYSCHSPTAPNQNPTPDTTSNNFTFQTFTFGASNAGSSHLSDVAIVSDSDIWCVGAVYLDSADGAPDPNAYNTVHWNGNKWDLKRIFYYGNCSAVRYPPLRSIFVFPDNKIVVTNGGSIGWINGDSVKLDCGANPLLTGAINKIWGTSGNDFYVVGNTGSILHYQNGSWQKIESGTTTAITDIWGSSNTILATVTNEYETGDKKLLQIKDNGTIDSLSWSPNSRLQTVWFQSMDKIFIGGGKHIVGKPGDWKEINELPAYYSESVRGNAPNDVFIVGAFGLCAHYNGNTWKTYNEPYNPNESLYGLAVENNLMVTVGELGNKAVIIAGKR